MRLMIQKFGTILVSRPAGREAFLTAKAYLIDPAPDETIELDFDGVNVLAPSWLDEFISGLKKNYANPVKIHASGNASVFESIKILKLN